MLNLQVELRLHHFILCMRNSGHTATSQLELLSVTPLSAAGCGRLQLGVPHLAIQ